MILEKLKVKQERAVLFAEIAAPPMNLLGPELVRDLVSLIQQVEADQAVQALVLKSADPDYFISHVDVARINDYQEQVAKLEGATSLALLFRRLSTSRLVTSHRSKVECAPLAASSCSRATCALRPESRQSSANSSRHSGCSPARVAPNISCASWVAGERWRFCSVRTTMTPKLRSAMDGSIAHSPQPHSVTSSAHWLIASRDRRPPTRDGELRLAAMLGSGTLSTRSARE